MLMRLRSRASPLLSWFFSSRKSPFKFEIRRHAEGADFSRFISVGQEASDLKITFARFGALGLPGFDLHRFDLVVDLVQPMLKLRGLDLHANLAALAHDMSFAVLLDFPHQQRVLEAALGTSNVYRFVLKHIDTSRQPYKIRDDTDFAGSQDFNANSIGGSRQTERLN